MGKVVIAQGRELIKTSARIDINGQEIDPKTKQIVESDAPYVPTKNEIVAAQEKTISKPIESQLSGAASLTDIIDALARKKVESITKLVDERVVEILKESIK